MFILSFVFLTGCTRPEGKSSRVTFELPKIMSQKTMQGVSEVTNWAHIVVNMSAPDMALKFCLIDVEEKRITGKGCYLDSKGLSIDATSGSDRLLQVTLVGQDGENMTFYYGDTKLQLSIGDNTAEISLLKVAEVKDIGGRVKGRYLKSDGTGPTGIVDVKFAVGGKPAMIVNQIEMINGWFESFLIPELGLDFVLDGKVNLFGQKMSIESFASLADVLPYDRIDKVIKSGGTKTDYQFVGFFGPGSVGTGKISCQSTQTPCTSAITSKTKYVDYIYSDQTDFNSAFAKTSGSALAVANQTISWTLLPGVKDVIDGFKLFYIPASFPETNLIKFNSGENLIDCDRLQTESGVVGVSKIPAGNTQYIFDASYDLVNGRIALCPFKGLYNYKNIASSNLVKNSGSNEKYLRIEISGGASFNSSSGNYDVIKSSCYEIHAKAFEGMGNSYLVSQNTSYAISPSANFYIYSPGDSTCASAPMTSVPLTFYAGTQTASEVYHIKFMTLGLQMITLTKVTGDDLTFNPSYNLFNVFTTLP